ncbi:helix-turn-helix domain-containing protein [Gramella jeungdoensis]|uniref:Helix-turn-helix domain-containing protein n=1 Tax=Gramella jeungdoensis TaxID=708091 RepID=A0ABT0YZL2_9FLAO|nr:helix-turn-helix transcriptional regulator [Gramella jeungdoensis]MCM8568907.1 helix-turn-helix domain-containing protein [Gramella jeungdoensis]
MTAQLKVGKRILHLRNDLGLSQEKLALKADIDRTYLTGVENGKRNISIKNIEKICKALEISLKDFFNDNLFDLN